MRKIATLSLSALAAAAGLAVSTTALAAAPVAGADARRDVVDIKYYKESKLHAIDATRIAVYDPHNTLDAALRAGAEARDVPGWSFVTLAPELRTPETVRQLVANPRPVLALEERTEIDPSVFVSPVLVDVNGGPMYILPAIYVRFDHTVTPEAARKRLDQVGTVTAMAAANRVVSNCYRVDLRGGNGFTIAEAAAQLASEPNVIFAEPESISTASFNLIPNDAGFAQLWGHRNTTGAFDFDMDSTDAWDVNLGSATVKVVVLDSGVQQNHPDINQLPGEDFTSAGTLNGAPGNVCDNHGTTVASCVSAIINNSIGTVGVAPGVKAMSGKVTISNLNCSGSGGTYSQTWHNNALDWAFNAGARVSNASFSVGFSGLVDSAYTGTRDTPPGMVHFASSGNNPTGTLPFPANGTSVMAVGATNRFGARAGFSNFGFGLDILAPGEAIYVCDRTGGDGYVFGDYLTTDGTSYSSPYAAGVAALVISQNPSFTPTQIENRMTSTARDMGTAGYDTEHGWGMISAYAAMTGTQAPPPPGPGTFTLLYPPNNATIADASPTFDWTDSTEVNNYLVTVDDNSNFSSPLFTVSVGASQLFTSPGSFAENVTYYWRVIAQNPVGNTNSVPFPANFKINTAPPPPCPGDFDGNGQRNTVDLVTFLSFFGSVQPPNTNGDLDGNGLVNTVDLVSFLAVFGVPCP
ncbi:MAG: S8 family serine peptidase [Phycisphaerales bacterium]